MEKNPQRLRTLPPAEPAGRETRERRERGERSCTVNLSHNVQNLLGASFVGSQQVSHNVQKLPHHAALVISGSVKEREEIKWGGMGRPAVSTGGRVLRCSSGGGGGNIIHRSKRFLLRRGGFEQLEKYVEKYG